MRITNVLFMRMELSSLVLVCCLLLPFTQASRNPEAEPPKKINLTNTKQAGYAPNINNNRKQNCTKRDSCTCVRNNGADKGINLHHLDTAPTPRFQIQNSDGIIQWNPCTGFSLDKTENDVAVSFGFSVQDSFIFGYQKTAEFLIIDDLDVLVYRAEEKVSQIHLVCNEAAFPSFTASVSGLNDTLVGKYIGPCSSLSKTISTGSVLLILFFSLLILYFLIGLSFNVYVKKADGFERIPNVEFWSDLPFLIKDGCIYTFSRRRRNKASYQEI